jgi:hypothetical protein
VNGCPTQEIPILRGLKQGDPLAPLLFLLVAEGLGGLMRSAVAINKFRPFLVGGGMTPVSLLQYADDTLFIGEATIENLWVLKAIHRGFEMASGLKVNFSKSCILGVNLSQEFLGMASDFLNCRVGRTPFKYLGLPVGASSRKLATWEPMLDSIRSRLNSWRNKFVSFGGRIILINAVLNAIPIFYLSYMKMPKTVWRELVKIQRKFLWGGLSNGVKTCWVKWEDVCRPKMEAGLGIRDLRIVNNSLLAKWRWKLLVRESEPWKEIVTARYGVDVIGKRILGAVDSLRAASSWWRDLCLLDSDDRWFSSAVKMKVGRGDMTVFWDEHWIGDQPLRHTFPRLYGISEQKQGLIHDMGRMIDDVWHWDLRWRRNLFLWEEEQYGVFRALIDGFVQRDASDMWLWLADGIEGFNVNSAYILLESAVQNTRRLEPVEDFVFKRLWKGAAPSKVRAFAWQLLLDRIQTKDNLFKRRLIQPDQLRCVMCNQNLESAKHLFLHCAVAGKVWFEINKWLGFYLVTPPNLFISFALWTTCGRNKFEKAGPRLIWFACIWVLWRSRNDCVFNSDVVNHMLIVDKIKLVSWQWFIGRLATNPCLLYEWQWSPIDCLHA